MTKRLESLDVMRGITIAAMILFNNPGGPHSYAPLSHSAWDGLTPTDLAFPFFMFIMGVALCFSLKKYSDGRKASALCRIFRRTVAIFFLGLIVSNIFAMIGGTFTFGGMRIMGVLQRLALVYLFGALVYLFVPTKFHLPIAFALLAGYIVLLKCGNGYVHSSDNLLARVDCFVLGGNHMITENADGVRFAFEPESLLGTISGIAHVLLGAFVGRLVLDNKENCDRVRKIALFGSALLFCGFLLQYLDPINKKIWTSSYTLVTCGAASLLLALLIEIIDVRGHARWGSFFKVLGTNAIFAYMLSQIVSALSRKFGIKKMLYASVLQPVFGDCGGSLAYALLVVLLVFALTLPLYKKKVFLRV